MLHVDESSREIFFTGGGKEEGNPYHIYLYKVNFDGSGLTCLTPEKEHTVLIHQMIGIILLLHILQQKIHQSLSKEQKW